MKAVRDGQQVVHTCHHCGCRLQWIYLKGMTNIDGKVVNGYPKHFPAPLPASAYYEPSWLYNDIAAGVKVTDARGCECPVYLDEVFLDLGL